MRSYYSALVGLTISRLWGQQPSAPEVTKPPSDPIKMLVGRLDLAHYKATIKALTKFGDRRENTDRNRAAVDWIEAQLKSYGCTNTERIHYEWTPFTPPQAQARFPAAGRWRSHQRRTRVQAGAGQRSRRATRRAASPTQYAAFHAWPR
jgi:hypothetical protein